MRILEMELDWNSKETRERFREVLALLCAGDYPPTEMVDAWLDSDDESLQTFCVREAGLTYLTGISIVEVAQTLVDEAFGNTNIFSDGSINW
jgi:hypothetical protein